MINIFEYRVTPSFGRRGDGAAMRIEGNTIRSIPVDPEFNEDFQEVVAEIKDDELAALRDLFDVVGFQHWNREYFDGTVCDGTYYKIKAGRKAVTIYHDGPLNWDILSDAMELFMARVCSEPWEG
jgi:hypothetical protein